MASAVEVNSPITNCKHEIIRPVANFSPSLWGDLFTSFHMDTQLAEMYAKEIEELKEEARSMLIFHGMKVSEKLILIDTIERLGLYYHFQKEIQEQLTLTFNGYYKLKNEEENDLFIVALQFRLLRQHGFDISSCIFNRFTEKNGEFKKTLFDDIKGVLSLYEAAYLRTQGEEILEKALSFSSAHLEFVGPNLSESPLRKQVLHALEQSLHRGIPRVESRRFISLYEEDESKNESLLRLAKLDFNLLQMLHKKELYEVSRWWKELDLVSKLSYARDRIVECYFWTLGVYFEPQYSAARIMLTKTIAMISVIDDTYDAYGTIKELTVFTDAVQKWDISEIDGLPDYMKICYKALLNLYEGYDEELAPKGRSYAVYHAKEAMKEIVMSYYIEAKWFIEGYLPPFAEYMKNAKVTSTYYLLTATSFIGMDSATNEAFNWLLRKPKILEANVTICRVIDDVATYEVEKSRGQVATGIECYMKENGVSTQVAIEYFNEIADNAWKDMNEGLKDTSVSMDILMRVFNLARLIDVVYKHNEDGYTHPEKVLKPHITALFVDFFELY
ncbi:Viridiflorene synthase [Handroanthus impetiginosus]|uniref:Viridiflorene synthase n=1 Tax=Handroanthus impetiginosus TaxID=429701 RepID=A0A2G9GNL0_9LAMI|nr:Viridiflorene synthase [Handroanthus impetiginosus]